LNGTGSFVKENLKRERYPFFVKFSFTRFYYSQDHMSPASVIGLAVGLVVFTIIISLAMWILYRKKLCRITW